VCMGGGAGRWVVASVALSRRLAGLRRRKNRRGALATSAENKRLWGQWGSCTFLRALVRCSPVTPALGKLLALDPGLAC
jgi:hypothetical protein